MSAYATAGDASKAVATYERYAQALQKELGLKPWKQTLTLYRRLKTDWKMDAPKSTVDKPSPAPPLPKLRRSNLPRPLTSFIGREKEIQQVKRLVSKVRLVTITSSGGVDKTRLAIQVAEALAPRFRDGVLNYFQESLSLNNEVGDKLSITANLVSMAVLAIRLEKPEMAAHLHGVVDSRLESLSVNLLLTDQAEFGRIRNKLLACLDEATFKAAFTEGREMSKEQAIELVGKIMMETE